MSTKLSGAHLDDQSILMVDLIIAESCNLQCRYCYESYKVPRLMTPATCKEALQKTFEQAQRERRYSLVQINFFGGEPFLNFELIREVSEWMWERDWPLDYTLGIMTNGTLLNDRMRSWFSLNKSRISVSLSLDGLGQMQQRNRTSHIVDVDFFVKNWPQNGVTMILFGDTIALFADTVKEMLTAGIKINVAIGGGFRWTKEQAIVYEQQLEELMPLYIKDIAEARHCGIFTNPEHFYAPIPEKVRMCRFDNTQKLCYDARGHAYACHMFTPLVVGEKMSARLEHIGREQESVNVDPRCRQCPIFLMCKVCPPMNVKVTGHHDLHGAFDTTCIMFKVQARQSAVLYLKYYLSVAEQGLLLSPIEQDIVRHSLRLLQDIPPAAQL